MEFNINNGWLNEDNVGYIRDKIEKNCFIWKNETRGIVEKKKFYLGGESLDYINYWYNQVG
jgi:hypothetical protein